VKSYEFINLKIIFSGTPEFAAIALEILLEQKHRIVGVLTQPDRQSGRGLQFLPSPVKQLATKHGICSFQPTTLKNQEIQHQLSELNADLMIVAAYGLILPKAVLEIPKYGCLNIHASILPRWRGAAPIQRAILAGDNKTGITIIEMDEGLDTGKMLLKEECIIAANDTAASLQGKLARIGGQLAAKALIELKQGGLNALTQDSSVATYAAKLNKAEARLDWSENAIQLERAVRAYQPYPIAHSYFNEIQLKILKVSIIENMSGKPGSVLYVDKNAIVVACGQGALALEVLQRPGGKVLPCSQFLQGFPVVAGENFT
jgi:methionyl-tRNA formyltransferase